MNIIMVIVLKVLFPYGLSLIYIMIYSVIFRNELTNVSNSSKGVTVSCRVPPLPPRRGLGRDTIDIFMEVITDKDSFDLKLPREVIC